MAATVLVGATILVLTAMLCSTPPDTLVSSWWRAAHKQCNNVLSKRREAMTPKTRFDPADSNDDKRTTAEQEGQQEESRKENTAMQEL